jgi:hypothetical protein
MNRFIQAAFQTIADSGVEDDDPTCLGQLAEGIDRDRPEGGISEMELVLKKFFPHEMAVVGCLLTNAPSIWLHKYFDL